MNELVRAQLLEWGRRYRGLGFGLIAAAVVMATFPSVAPSEGNVVPDGFASVAPEAGNGAGSTESPGQATPSSPSGHAPSIASNTDAAGTVPPSNPPEGQAGPAIAPPPPPPEPTVTPCPLDLPRAPTGTDPLPLADVLNLISPALPLLGPFVPFALAGAPILEPVLPVVTPLLPAAAPVYIHLGPVVGDLTGSLVELEAILLLPIEEPLATYTPQMLEAEKNFIDQLQPLLDTAAGTGVPDCAAIVTAGLGGLLVDIGERLGVSDLIEKILDLLG